MNENELCGLISKESDSKIQDIFETFSLKFAEKYEQNINLVNEIITYCNPA